VVRAITALAPGVDMVDPEWIHVELRGADVEVDISAQTPFDGTVAVLDRAWHENGVMTSSSPSAFAGFRFPREVISVAVRW